MLGKTPILRAIGTKYKCQRLVLLRAFLHPISRQLITHGIRLIVEVSLKPIMKHSLLIFVFILFSQRAFGQVQSNCTDNADLIAREYALDIHRIVVERLWLNRHPDTSEIIIPQVHLDSMIGNFTAVFNVGKYVNTDSLFDNYCVHDFTAARRKIYIKLDTNIAWTKTWLEGKTTTNYKELDELIEKYEFKVDIHPLEVRLVSPKLVNRGAFCNSLKKFEGIIEAYPYPVILHQSVDYVGHYSKDNASHLLFHFVWKNASSYERHVWEYKIDNNCIVTGHDSIYQLSINPQPYPTPTNCNISAGIVKQDIKVYPNPINGLAIISTSEEGIIEVYSLSGRRLKRYISFKGYTPIDLSDLASGIYIIKHKTTSGKIKIQKIVKE